eukprot:symbB.v1.2.019796.t1/scaffold1636.1/size108148/1
MDAHVMRWALRLAMRVAALDRILPRLMQSTRSGSRSGSGGSRSSARSAADYRPLVERVKGGVKLFVGRLPVETTTDLLSRAFEEYGEVLEVFLIDGRGASGARCAFVRLAHLKDAERAMEEMHEKRVLIHERAELGPIQVAFAKGEATRMGLDAAKEQLPARWQVPITAGAPIIASGPVEPESLSKEALVSLIKEGQRSGGKSFKEQWWTYCDDGRGGVADYDPKRHPEKQFFAACQAGEWGAKPWFRRAVNWATMGGDRGKRSRGRRRRRSSSSSSSGSSRSKSRSSSKSKRTRGQSEGSRPAPAPKDTKLGDQPPLPVEAPPPEPDAVHPPPKARLLASAAERDTELEDFLAKNRISPSTSFLMLKLTREQASSVMSSVSQALDKTGASGLARSGRSAAESLVLQKLKGLGVRAPSGGAWTSTERTASPVPPAAERIKKSEAESREKEGTLVGLDLPSVDGLLGLVDLEEDRKEEGVETAEITEARADRKECPPAVESDTAATAADEKPTAMAEPPEAKDGETSPKEEPLESIARQGPLNCQVFVKNLDKTTGEPELRDLLSKHGTVQNVEMATEGTSVTKGFAIVIMSSKKEAKDCVKALNFTKPWGRALIVERPEGIEDSPSRSPSKEKEAAIFQHSTFSQRRSDMSDVEAVKPALSIEEQKRSKSKSRSVSHESGWSRYTIEGKGQRSRARRRSPRRRHQKRSRPKKKASRTRSSRSSSKGSDSSDSRSDRAKKRRKDRSRKRHRDRERPRDLEKEVPPMGLPGWPGAPPFMPMPGMPMMPPPWAMPPWGMPSMPGMTAVPMEHNGFPFDAEEAERQLRRAEKAARKEQQRQKEEDEDDKKQVWEDHPARMAQKKHSSSRQWVPLASTPPVSEPWWAGSAWRVNRAVSCWFWLWCWPLSRLHLGSHLARLYSRRWLLNRLQIRWSRFLSRL